jgi:hypothetical protein
MPFRRFINWVTSDVVAFSMSLEENSHSSRPSSPSSGDEHTPSSDYDPSSSDLDLSLSQGPILDRQRITTPVAEPPSSTTAELSLVTTSPGESISQAPTPLPCIAISNVSHELSPSSPVSLGLATVEDIAGKETLPP